MAKLGEVIEGLEILAKYVDGGRNAHAVDAQHDVIYAGPYDISKVSPEDTERLKMLGWHVDGDGGGWARFT